MQIIQFRCPIPEIAAQLKYLMTRQANEWGRTNIFNLGDWQIHAYDPDLYWVDWGTVYENLDDSGRIIADQLLKPGDFTGILLGKPLLPQLPNTFLEIIEVDPVESGHLTASIEQE